MNEQRFIIYDQTSGKIEKIYKGTESDATLNAGVGQMIFFSETANIFTDYFDLVTEDISPRPLQACAQDPDTIVSDGSAECIITLMEVDSECYIDNVSQGINPDSDWHLTFDTVGIYKIKIVKFPYLDKEFTINAN